MSIVAPAPSVPTSFKEIKSWSKWRPMLRLLAKTGKTIMVAEGEAFAGSYNALVITGKGFQHESGRAAMTAAFTGGSNPNHTPIRSMKQVAETAINLSAPLSDDPPDTPTPTESEIVAEVVQKIENLLGPSNSASTATKETAPARAQAFFETMIKEIPATEKYLGLRHVTFRFRVPSDFTQEEFDYVGRQLIGLHWEWEQLGRKGDSYWSFILDPGV